jgi:hypothetical protein
VFKSALQINDSFAIELGYHLMLVALLSNRAMPSNIFADKCTEIDLLNLFAQPTLASQYLL